MFTEIRRKNKVDAVKALCALVEKGWVIDTSLREIKSTVTQYGSYDRRRNRYTSKVTNESSCWYVKLRAPEREVIS